MEHTHDLGSLSRKPRGTQVCICRVTHVKVFLLTGQVFLWQQELLWPTAFSWLNANNVLEGK